MQPTIFLYQKQEATAVDPYQASTLSVYPNPASDYIRIDLDEAMVGTVNMYNVTGSRVLHRQIDSKNMEIDLSSLNAGMYLISIDSDNYSSRTTKILVR
jgi:hypothetical protein